MTCDSYFIHGMSLPLEWSDEEISYSRYWIFFSLIRSCLVQTSDVWNLKNLQVTRLEGIDPSENKCLSWTLRIPPRNQNREKKLTELIHYERLVTAQQLSLIGFGEFFDSGLNLLDDVFDWLCRARRSIRDLCSRLWIVWMTQSIGKDVNVIKSRLNRTFFNGESNSIYHLLVKRNGWSL